MRDFLKNIFTLKTVYIDKGSGRWATKKRFHPFMRGALSFLFLILCAGVYVNAGKNNSADVPLRQAEAITVTAKLSEPVKTELPPVAMKPKAEPEKKSEPIIIPLSNKKKTVAKKSEIILPSEANPGTDRIIAPSKPNKKISDKYRILINKSKYTLSLFKGNELVKTYPVAVGKNKGDKERVGDNRTPVGNFKIVSMENASSWSHDFHDGKGKIAGAYGPYFLRLDAKGWKGIGIHGTHDPDSRGTNATEGCIRLSNEDIAELRENYAYRNMPVVIQE